MVSGIMAANYLPPPPIKRTTTTTRETLMRAKKHKLKPLATGIIRIHYTEEGFDSSVPLFLDTEPGAELTSDCRLDVDKGLFKQKEVAESEHISRQNVPLAIETESSATLFPLGTSKVGPVKEQTKKTKHKKEKLRERSRMNRRETKKDKQNELSQRNTKEAQAHYPLVSKHCPDLLTRVTRVELNTTVIEENLHFDLEVHDFSKKSSCESALNEELKRKMEISSENAKEPIEFLTSTVLEHGSTAKRIENKQNNVRGIIAKFEKLTENDLVTKEDQMLQRHRTDLLETKKRPTDLLKAKRVPLDKLADGSEERENRQKQVLDDDVIALAEYISANRHFLCGCSKKVLSGPTDAPFLGILDTSLPNDSVSSCLTDVFDKISDERYPLPSNDSTANPRMSRVDGNNHQ